MDSSTTKKASLKEKLQAIDAESKPVAERPQAPSDVVDVGADPVKHNRADRSSEGREARKRKRAWARSQILPSPDEHPDYDYKWVRAFIGSGEVDDQNFSKSKRDGWEPVGASDVGELMVEGSSNERFSGNVIIQGMLLCRRPKYIGEEIVEDAVEESRRQLESIDNNYLSDSNKHMRKFSDRTSTVKRSG